MKKQTKAQKKIETVMREFKADKLKSGSKKGPKVKKRSQAIAIALSEARKAGAHIPKKTRSKSGRKKENSRSNISRVTPK